MVGVEPTLADSGPAWADPGPMWPTLAEVGRRWAEVGRIRPKCGRSRPSLGRFRTKFWPMFVELVLGHELDPSLAEFDQFLGPMSHELDPDSANFGRFRWDSAGFGSTSARIPTICTALVPEGYSSTAAPSFPGFFRARATRDARVPLGVGYAWVPLGRTTRAPLGLCFRPVSQESAPTDRFLSRPFEACTTRSETKRSCRALEIAKQNLER